MVQLHRKRIIPDPEADGATNGQHKANGVPVVNDNSRAASIAAYRAAFMARQKAREQREKVVNQQLPCDKDLANLRESGLTDETIRANRLYSVVGDSEKLAQILNHDYRSNACLGGLVIPYRDLAGGVNGFARVRPHCPRKGEGGKPIKYEQPNGEPPRAYYPFEALPGLRDGTSPIYITEGEKKALVLGQLGLAAVGIGGVWGWNVKGTDELIPYLAAVQWAGRDVFIVFDFDVKPETRNLTALSATRLGKALRKAGVKAIYNVELPPRPDDGKMGVDDSLVAYGDKAFHALVAVARSTSSQRPQNSGKKNSGQILLGIALAEAELWHTPDNTAFATLERDGVREHYGIRSKTYCQWLNRRYYDSENNIIGTATLQSVIDTLEGKARFDGPVYPLALRVGGTEGKVYIDLVDDQWRAVEIDAQGWRVVNNPPVRFRRTKGMFPLPLPETGGTLGDLRPFVNVSDEAWPLYLAWLVGSFRPSGPYFVLKVYGEQGTAKTAFGEVSRKLIDPNAAPLRRSPSNDRDLMIAAKNGWVVAFDNLSHVTPDLSDALCSLATGGGFATRMLYSDDEETIIVAERPILLNGIEEVGTRSDLMNRSIAIELPRIGAKDRKAEDVFWAEFDAAWPRILGALFDAVSMALARLAEVKASGKEWPRMADAAQWATAAEPALGLEDGVFLEAYKAMRETANNTALEWCPVYTAIVARLKVRRGKLHGTATALHDELSINQDTKAKGWPQSARPLSGILQRLAPNLRLAGIEVTHQTVKNEKIWTIEQRVSEYANTQNAQTGGQILAIPSSTGSPSSRPSHSSLEERKERGEKKKEPTPFTQKINAPRRQTPSS